VQLAVVADVEGIDVTLQAVPCRLAAAVDAVDAHALSVGFPRLGHPDLFTFHPFTIPERG